ncbi:OmpA family protein [Myroides odoratimimus]|uniref:OmpA/MotB family protein n=1 Tax=Myroides odoratimimus TaxID=76832 RepID=UPI000910D0A2|nr:OmpA family protein [Myroides odoratimimus]MDM1510072.1 OmpA family protein [Myroides odoratimimus]MDM1526853.1 OmpA family protein [Myroides odoratimimus]MDM1680094.1 OmpA family protein [Myroides odoratimimus]MEC4035798.1 OmpA family protein [Myroides odoratimimus]MEC4094835.1 OmpA family protein [Myroides odoratimimus]
MSIKKISLGLLALTMLSSCVTRKLYNELDQQYKDALAENEQLSSELDLMNSSNTDLENIKRQLAAQLKELQQERSNLNAEIAAAQNKLRDLEKSYNNLEQHSAETLKAEAARLAKAKTELEEKSRRVAELESILAANDKQMRTLKDNLSNALNAFEGRGLTIEQKNGRVYVSMENKLLFKSGSWTISDEGKEAVVELGKVLADNPDITVLIEGHTDNDKILGNLGDGVKTNWDLSTKRSLTIVSILEQTPQIDKRNLTAAGRSEYAPLASNNTAEGKAKNRRIEVILTPNLDKINSMLNQL